MATESIEFFDATRCWLCGKTYKNDERVCFNCGSTRVLSHDSVRLERNALELIELTRSPEATYPDDEDGEPIPARRGRPRQPASSFGTSDLALYLAYGALGAFIGGSLWCVIAVLWHSDVGALAILMGYFTGKGIAMAALYRRGTLTLIAMLVTAGMWDVCTALIISQGISLTPLDAAFYVVSLIAAAIPIDFLPRNLTAR